MWMEKVAQLKNLQNLYLGNQEKPRKPSANLFGFLIELRNSHLLNIGKKRCGLCEIVRFLKLLGDKLLKLRTSTLA